MENAVYKTYRATVKEVDDATGEIEMMIPISSRQMDRDGEIIEPEAFKKTIPKFMKHPVLVASHDYRDLTNQIGEWQKLKVEEDGVSGKPKYYVNAGNAQADWAYYLASKGVAAFSVGFIPKQWEDGKDEKSPRRTYKEVELLEISQVIIPSNREAVQSMRSKSVDPVITELCDEVEKELITKPEETSELIRIPVRDCEVTATIDISKKEGISALYCGKEKQVRTYLFRKDKGWTLESAKAWVKEHDGKSLEEGIEVEKQEHPQPKAVSQQQIMDEIDYLKTLVNEIGMSAQVAKALQVLSGSKVKMGMGMMRDMQKMHDMMADCEEKCGKAGDMSEEMMADMEEGEKSVKNMGMMRRMQQVHDMVTDSEDKAGKAMQMSEDLMDEMESEEDMDEHEDMEDEKHVKAGAVLNKKNKDRLAQIKKLAQEVLNSAGVAEEEEEKEEEKRSPGNDMPVEEKNNVDDILSTIQSLSLSGGK